MLWMGPKSEVSPSPTQLKFGLPPIENFLKLERKEGKSLILLSMVRLIAK